MNKQQHTFNIDGISYTLDLEKAKSLGLLHIDGITKFHTGDLFLLNNGNKVLIIPCGYPSSYNGECDTWSLAGLDGTLRVYSSFGKKGATESEMLQWLNDQPRIRFVKNINKDLANLLTSIC